MYAEQMVILQKWCNGASYRYSYEVLCINCWIVPLPVTLN